LSDTGPSDETLRLVYELTCQSYHGIADFRGKLLALLPLASGTGIFLLLGDAAPKQLLAPIGVFGVVVTMGLFIYELRGIQRCHRLENQAEALEDALNLAPDQRGILHLPERDWHEMLEPPAASLIVYLAVIFAWLYVAGEMWRGPYNWLAPLKAVGLCLVYVIVLFVSWRRVRSWLHETTQVGGTDRPLRHAHEQAS
jgi:hypothetical protein